jgi:SAM-dependent methyltransferase
VAEANQRVFERDATDYGSRELQRPEQLLLGRLRDRWREISMLDIGIGSGRTTYTFAPLVRRYVGLDYVPRMVELARQSIGEDERTTLEVGDARRLTDVVDGKFDLVLFSYNGIDYVGYEDRLEVLAQIRRMVAEDGWFCFSTHSAAALPIEPPPLGISIRRPLRSVYRAARRLRERRLVSRSNQELDLDELRARGWGVVKDSAHGFDLWTMYVTMEHQLRELADAGFGEVEIYDLSGTRVDPSWPGRDPWLYYLCRPSSPLS